MNTLAIVILGIFWGTANRLFNIFLAKYKHYQADIVIDKITKCNEHDDMPRPYIYLKKIPLRGKLILDIIIVFINILNELLF